MKKMNTKAKETNKYLPRYFRRDSTPYPDGDKGLFEWAKDFGKADYKRVAEKNLWWGGWVSTVWMGIDHNFSPNPKHKPLFFETMVFYKNYSDLDMDRYSTEQEAIEGHNRMVKKWSNPVTLIKYLFKR